MFKNVKLGCSSILAASALLSGIADVAHADDGKLYAGSSCSYTQQVNQDPVRNLGIFIASERGTATCPTVRETIGNTSVTVAEITVRGVGRSECWLGRVNANGRFLGFIAPDTSVGLADGHVRHVWFNGSASVSSPAGVTWSFQCSMDPGDKIVSYRLDESA